jgi:hypothetical protein
LKKFCIHNEYYVNKACMFNWSHSSLPLVSRKSTKVGSKISLNSASYYNVIHTKKLLIILARNSPFTVLTQNETCLKRSIFINCWLQTDDQIIFTRVHFDSERTIVQHEFVVNTSQQRYTVATLRRRFETAKYVRHKKTQPIWAAARTTSPDSSNKFRFVSIQWTVDCALK